MIDRQRLLSAVLIAGVAITSVLIYSGSEPDLEISPVSEQTVVTKPNPSETAPKAVVPAPGLDVFSEVVERPLFSRSRRPQPIDDKSVTPADVSNRPVQKDQFLVMGIIITGEEKLVLLKPTGKSSDVFRVREGERVLEWTVESVTPETVTLRQGDLTDTLKLSDNVLSQAEKRRLVQQRTRATRKDARQAAQKRRIRPASRKTPPTEKTNGTRPTSRRTQVPRPVTRGTPNGS